MGVYTPLVALLYAPVKWLYAPVFFTLFFLYFAVFALTANHEGRGGGGDTDEHRL